MAEIASTMVSLGSKAPSFSLLNTVDNKMVSLQGFKNAKGIVILFICNHCPFVIHINKQLVQIATKYQEKGIAFIAISSNDVEKYPQDAPKLMQKVALDNKYPFPYLYDVTQEVAKAYNAVCTPDVFVYNASFKLVYRGQLDNARPGNTIAVTGSDLRYALDCLLEKKVNTKEQKPSIGCGIKWKE